jgi:hypothetical protein
MRNFLLLGSLLVASASATGNDAIKYTCKMNDAERVIEVVYTSTDKPAPCSVSYTKDGTTQTLWSYESTEGQCEANAAEFADKQSSWGWSCNNGASNNNAPAATASAQ